jgi:hypothetical protein
MMQRFEPESLCAVTANERQYDFPALAHCVVRLFREKNDLFCPASSSLASFPEKFPGPFHWFPLHEPFYFNACRKLLFESDGIGLWHRDEMDVAPSMPPPFSAVRIPRNHESIAMATASRSEVLPVALWPTRLKWGRTRSGTLGTS